MPVVVPSQPVASNGMTRTKILSKPPTADLFVDGRPAGLRTPAVIELAPGNHSIEVVSGSARGLMRINIVDGGMTSFCWVFEEGRQYGGSCP